MKKSENYIKNVLNRALLQGRLSNEDKLLGILFRKYKDEIVFSEEEADSMIRDLQSSQQQILERRRKLSNVELINTLGEYLQLWQEENEIDDNRISKAVNVTIEEVENIKRNLISPIHVSIQTMARLINFLKLRFEEGKKLIEKTYIVHNIEFSGQAVLSRFDEKKPAIQGKSMRGAMEELLMKAHQKKPLVKESHSELQRYFSELEKEFKNIE